MGAWAGVERFLDYKLAEVDRKRLNEQKLRDAMTNKLLPELMKRRSAVQEAAKVRAQVYAKGSKLFGEKVATALENMGALADVVSQYGSSEDDIGWAKTIVARTEDTINQLLNSEDPEKQERGAMLLKRGAMLAGADDATKADAISEILADGQVTLEEFYSYSPGSTAVSAYEGQLPELSRYKELSNSELSKAADELLMGALGELVELREVDGVARVVPKANLSPRAFSAAKTEVMDQLNQAVRTVGLPRARRQVESVFPSIMEKYDLKKPSGAIVPPKSTEPDVQNVQEGAGGIELNPPLQGSVPQDNSGWAIDIEEQIDKRGR